MVVFHVRTMLTLQVLANWHILLSHPNATEMLLMLLDTLVHLLTRLQCSQCHFIVYYTTLHPLLFPCTVL